MLTRGTLLGEILDELANIKEKVDVRAGCQIYDLPVFAENFTRDILKYVLGCEFKNLNSERSNNPGVDLGATNKKFAIQVTATSSSAKINKTLAAITDAQRKKYNRFIVLILGKKQSSYKIDPDLALKNKNFDAGNDIWDLKDIAKMAFDLKVDKLHLLHREIRNQTLKLQVDLEIRKKGGNFKTTGYSLWEALPVPKVGNGNRFIKWLESTHSNVDDGEKALIKKELSVLASQLVRLPRLTREFFVSLIQRRDPKGTTRFPDQYGWQSILLSSIERQYIGSDIQGELDLLMHEGIIDIRHRTDEDYDDGPSCVGYKFSYKSDDLNFHFMEYLEFSNHSIRKAIGDIDLSIF